MSSQLPVMNMIQSAPFIHKGDTTNRHHMMLLVSILPVFLINLYITFQVTLVHLVVALLLGLGIDALWQHAIQKERYELRMVVVWYMMMVVVIVPHVLVFWGVAVVAAITMIGSRLLVAPTGRIIAHPVACGVLLVAVLMQAMSMPYVSLPVAEIVILGHTFQSSILYLAAALISLGIMAGMCAPRVLVVLGAACGCAAVIVIANVPPPPLSWIYTSLIAALFVVSDGTASPASSMGKLFSGILFGLLLAGLYIYWPFHMILGVYSAVLLSAFLTPLIDQSSAVW